MTRINKTPKVGNLRLIKYTFIVLMIFAFSGCSNNTVYESYNKFENLNWQRFDTQMFEFQVVDIAKEYDIYIAIRHIPEIPYQEFLLNYTFYTPSGDMRSNDITLELYDNENNKLSNCLGDLCDFVYPIRKGLKISEPGTIIVEIENKYPKVDMLGIIEVGLIVKESE